MPKKERQKVIQAGDFDVRGKMESKQSTKNFEVDAIENGANADIVISTGVTKTAQAKVKHTASAVNQACLKGSATGAAVSVVAEGTDTNVGVRQTPKGTGVVGTDGPATEKMTQTALTDTATVTAAQLLTKVLDGTPTAAATYTLPTAALLVAAMPGVKVGDSFIAVVNNKSGGANTITVEAGAGGTGDGTLTVAQNVIRAFLIIITNVTAASEAYFVYGLGA